MRSFLLVTLALGLVGPIVAQHRHIASRVDVVTIGRACHSDFRRTRLVGSARIQNGMLYSDVQLTSSVCGRMNWGLVLMGLRRVNIRWPQTNVAEHPVGCPWYVASPIADFLVGHNQPIQLPVLRDPMPFTLYMQAVVEKVYVCGLGGTPAWSTTNAIAVRVRS